jgi:hypothetical protein
MTPSEFADVFAVLAVQLREKDADAVTIRAYYAALQDLELPLVKLAAKNLATTATWFPKTSEWRTEVEKIRSRRMEEQKAIIRRLKAPLCAECNDIGKVLGADNRVSRCDCQKLRALEVAGFRPMPKLLPASPAEIRKTQIRLRKLIRDGFGFDVEKVKADK